jgi:hypothetical protein
MPKLTDHSSQSLVKLCVVGLSGSRKTSGLASLAKAGYNLYILDYDNGLSILFQVLKDDPQALARVEYETLNDKFKNVGNRVVCNGPPTAWNKGIALLSNWPEKGPLDKWTSKDVLVIDSLTLMGLASLRSALYLVGRELKPEQQDWGAAMDAVEKMIMLITSPEANCNVVVNTHVNYTENADGSGVIGGLPSALGNKLSPKIPIYFDNVLVSKNKGFGATRQAIYMLRGDGLVEGKSVALGQTELPNATGLADFFALVKGK